MENIRLKILETSKNSSTPLPSLKEPQLLILNYQNNSVHYNESYTDYEYEIDTPVVKMPELPEDLKVDSIYI